MIIINCMIIKSINTSNKMVIMNQILNFIKFWLSILGHRFIRKSIIGRMLYIDALL